MNEILEISDKVTVLRDGIKVLTDKTSELSKEKSYEIWLVKIYLIIFQKELGI